MTFPLTLLFMFLVFWRPQEWLLPWLYGWPLLQIIGGLAVISLAMEVAQNNVRFPKTPAVWLAVGLFFASIMSHLAHGYFAGMMDAIPVAFRLCLFLILLLVVTNSIKRLQWVVFILLFGACVMAVHAIMQERTGSGFGGQLPIRFFYTPKDRWVQQSLFFGIFQDPNDLGQFLATCIPLAFAVPKRLRFTTFILAVGAVWLLADGMLATQSRGTLVGVIASVGCIIFMWLPVKWLPYIGGLALLGGVVACAFGGGALLDESAHDRVVFWGEANRYFKHNFIFGGGLGMFGEITGTDRAAHNAFVLCYTELGLFGYWFWFNMLTLGIIGCWRVRMAFRRTRNPEQAYLRRVAGLCIASMAGFAASSYFLSRAYAFPLFFLFAILASVPVIAEKYLGEDRPPFINTVNDVFIMGSITSMSSVVYIYITILLLNKAYGY